MTLPGLEARSDGDTIGGFLGSPSRSHIARIRGRAWRGSQSGCRRFIQGVYDVQGTLEECERNEREGARRAGRAGPSVAWAGIALFRAGLRRSRRARGARRTSTNRSRGHRKELVGNGLGVGGIELGALSEVVGEGSSGGLVVFLTIGPDGEPSQGWYPFRMEGRGFQR
jgi:hypothetical protein